MASGKRAGVAAWKEALVSLAGPLTGIVVGCALAWILGAATGPARTAILSLLLINAFNLLPLGGLDGGHLFRRILFSRHRYLEIAFQALAGIALLLIAIWLKSWALGIFAYLGLGSLPYRTRLLAAASRLRTDLAGVADASMLDGPQWTKLTGAAHRAVGARGKPRPRVVARAMEARLQAMQPAPSATASLPRALPPMPALPLPPP